MNRVERFEGLDWAWAIALSAASVVLRLPFRSRLAYLWDSAEFALAIQDYNVSLSQPHAPGYFLYVMIGRLVNWFVGDPHASLVWMSVVAGSGLAAAMYLLGTAMFGRRTGVVAGLFAMTSPQVWFHSCVALTYVVDAFLVCVMVLWCWRAIQRGGSWGETVGIGAMLAVIGGVRQQTIPALVPLLVFVFWNFETQRLRRFVAALIVAAVLCAVWAHWMEQMSGGWRLYGQALHRIVEFQSGKTVAGGGWNALGWNLFFTVLFCWNGLMLGVAVLAGALFYRAFGCQAERRCEWDRRNMMAVRILWLWILPMMMLGVLVGYTETPGHVFTYLPGWLLVTAIVVAQLQRRWMYIGAVTVVCAMNAFTFTAWPRSWDEAFFGIGRTAREIREHDQQLAQVIHTIRRHLNPAEAAICHAREYLPLGLRHLQLYLPEFEQYQLALDPVMLSPAGKPMMRIRGGRLDFARGIEPTGKRVLALVVPRGTSLEDYTAYFDLSGAKPLPDSGGCVYTVPVEAMR